MSFFNLKSLAGAAMVLAACLSAAPSMAQENKPLVDGVPQLNRDENPQTGGSSSSTTQEVRGKVTRIDGKKVEIRTSSGSTRTYEISEADQQRNRISVGSDVVLTVRGDSVVAISPAGTSSSSSSSGSATGSTSSSGSSSSSSSSTTVRRTTTVQQTTRPAPRPAPAAAPEPQPVRGLW
jgi:antitoxin (DNA-binding transcriptional repressor) of toxin-antitoxin stability system